MLQLKREGRQKNAKIIQRLIDSDKDGCLNSVDEAVYTADEALALMLDCKLSKEDYQTLRSGALQKGSKLYPSYHSVLEAKERCIPPVTVTDYSAEVKLQELLDLTVRRILISSCIECPINSTIQLISKVYHKPKIRFFNTYI
jgi:hypothetical protein